MCKRILIAVILITLIVSGSVVAKEVLSAKIKLEDGSVIIGEIEKPLIISVKTKEGIKKIDIEDIVYLQMNVHLPTIWKLQGSWWLITGKTSPSGFRELHEVIGKSLGRGSLLGGYAGQSLVEAVEEDFESVERSNTIFLILPKTEEFEALKELREKYPELFPISSKEFKEFKKFSPLVYLTYDIKTEKMRGVVIADKVDSSLAKLLEEKELSLDVPLHYKDGQLKEIKGIKGK